MIHQESDQTSAPQKLDRPRILRTQAFALHSELETNLDAFKKAMSEYDESNESVDIMEEELDDLMSTHTFMDGSWTNRFIENVNQAMKEIEDKSKSSTIRRRSLLSFIVTRVVPKKSKSQE